VDERAALPKPGQPKRRARHGGGGVARAPVGGGERGDGPAQGVSGAIDRPVGCKAARPVAGLGEGRLAARRVGAEWANVNHQGPAVRSIAAVAPVAAVAVAGAALACGKGAAVESVVADCSVAVFRPRAARPRHMRALDPSSRPPPSSLRGGAVSPPPRRSAELTPSVVATRRRSGRRGYDRGGR